MLIWGIGPGKKGKLLPRNRSGAVQREVSQHVLEMRMLEGCYRLVALAQAKRTQQIEVHM